MPRGRRCEYRDRCDLLVPQQVAGGVGNNFSVIIPTKNRPEALMRSVRAILRQSATPRELIIVDQSERPDSAQAIKALSADADKQVPRLTYVLDKDIDGLASARNRGLELSEAPWTLFCDDDGIMDPDAIQLMGLAFASQPELLGVAGIVTTYQPPVAHARWFRRLFFRGPFWDERQPVYWNWRRYKRGELIPTGKLNGGLMAIRRDALIAIGGFDPRYRGSSVGEDIEISLRLQRYAGGAKQFAFVGGAWLRHDSLGDWKAKDRALEFELVCSHYLLHRSLQETFANRLRYSWILVGTALLAVASALRRLSLRPIRGWLSGLRCICSGYANCPFLKPGKAQERQR